MFDPYRKWLGIPEDERPPTHYQLLGISPEEQDLDVIESAVLRQSSFVRNFQSGPRADDATRLLNEIAAARLCLVDRRKRAKYDAELRKQRPSPAAQPSSAHHSDPVLPGAATKTPPRRPPSSTPPALDLDQLMPPARRRAASPARRVVSRGGAPLSRPRSRQSSAGYLWQAPLLTVILIVLILLARTIGRTIAEQRAQHAGPAAAAEQRNEDVPRHYTSRGQE